MGVLMKIGYLKVITRAQMRFDYLESDFGNLNLQRG
jgi:hypothetical protein